MTRKEIKELAGSEIVLNFHNTNDLNFVSLGNTPMLNKILLHTSRYWSLGVCAKGSEYFIAEVMGKPAYIRISDHWGTFSTKDEDVYTIHHWELVGDDVKRKDGKYKKTKQAGYIFL